MLDETLKRSGQSVLTDGDGLQMNARLRRPSVAFCGPDIGPHVWGRLFALSPPLAYRKVVSFIFDEGFPMRAQ